jgi:hypothetical protein
MVARGPSMTVLDIFLKQEMNDLVYLLPPDLFVRSGHSIQFIRFIKIIIIIIIIIIMNRV